MSPLQRPQEVPRAWIDSEGNDTVEAKKYMEALGALNQEILTSLSVPDDKKAYDFSEHTVVTGESLGGILKNKIPAFKSNPNLLTLSLVDMSTKQALQVQGVFVGDKIEVVGGKLKISNPARPGKNREAYLFSKWSSPEPEVLQTATTLVEPVSVEIQREVDAPAGSVQPEPVTSVGEEAPVEPIQPEPIQPEPAQTKEPTNEEKIAAARREAMRKMREEQEREEAEKQSRRHKKDR